MVGMLELPDQEFKTAVINIVRALVDKVDRMEEQMERANRETRILRKNQTEMPEMKNTVTKMKNV